MSPTSATQSLKLKTTEKIGTPVTALYGSTKLTGWTALHHGSFCYPQFTSFWHAITLLIRAWRVGNSCKIRNS
jgi:hypothetical protein